jgi:hypothetical protein
MDAVDIVWTRIPCDIPEESDRRRIISILADNGLAVRIVKVKINTRYKRYVEYADVNCTIGG